ncbi:MAG TPA: alpha-galactosidase [Thermotogota bacterium]|nr:alpha-galactosidase [Thermotogota bacterium]
MAIRYNSEKKLWVLETRNTAYSFGVYQSGMVKHTYWGKKLSRMEDYPGFDYYFDSPWWNWNDEFPTRGEASKTEPCLQLIYADGVRDVNLRYKTHEIEGEELRVSLNDELYNLEVVLVYKVFAEYDLFERSAYIVNRSDQDITVENFKSASFYLPQQESYQLTHLNGMWAHETRITREKIEPGKRVLESREGRTSAFHNPFFAIDDRATEDAGDVWFGLLAWGGNWKTLLHKIPYETVQICTGMNDWDFTFTLKAGEEFQAPPVHCGYTSLGFGEMSRNLHRFQLEKIMPKEGALKIRKVLYNSWEATAFDVNEENQKRLADKASQIGCEIFVIDDGWFGQRSDDTAGLGDWYVNREKFPNGLEPLIDYVNTKGMDFGIWIEPEMVNTDSDLYRAHPDWVLQFPNRPRTECRNQLILNLAREDVKRYVFESVDRLLTDYNVKFIKWDMNRPVYESGWLESEDPRRMWTQSVENLYDIWKMLKEKHPDVILEACSSGGARVDTAIMRYADQFWTSDNTDPYDRQCIQEGFSLCYNTKMMMGWVTDWGGKDAYPLEYRFHASMMGSLGIGSDLSAYTEEELKKSAELISLYKMIRNTVQNGSVYRIISPYEEPFTIKEYLSEDENEVVLFCMKNPSPLSLFKILRVKFKALQEDAVYRIVGTELEFSGAFLMYRGLDINFMQDYKVSVKDNNHFDSKIILLNRL